VYWDDNKATYGPRGQPGYVKVLFMYLGGGAVQVGKIGYVAALFTDESCQCPREKKKPHQKYKGSTGNFREIVNKPYVYLWVVSRDDTGLSVQ